MIDRDFDALRRAVEWGKSFQKREPQIVVVPTPMPPEGSPQWIEEAKHLVMMAQSVTLGLRPWQCEPASVHDDGVVDDGCYGRRANEVAVRRRLIALGLSVYEPDPPRAIAQAEHQRVA